jgi:hypothetical protein
MQHRVSADDREFLRRFDGCEVQPVEFDHRAHLKLAYIFLALHGGEQAGPRFRDSLQAFLRHNNIDPAKYHETMTQAWMLAVLHFMERVGDTSSAEEFVAASPALLNPGVMLTHYSKELIGSARARREFVEPDLDPIPRPH